MDVAEYFLKHPENALLKQEELTGRSLEAVKESLDSIAKKYSVLDEVYVEGLDAEQVWAQAKIVLDGVLEKVMEANELEKSESEDDEDAADGIESLDEEISDSNEVDDSDEEVDGSDVEERNQLIDDMAEEESGEEGSEMDLIDEEEPAELQEEGSEASHSEPSEEEEEDDDGNEEEDKFGLNDGHFDLKKFQEQVLAMEENNGGVSDGSDDDDEDIDYFASNMAQEEQDDEESDLKFDDFFASRKRQKRQYKKQPVAEQDEEEEPIENEEEFYENAFSSMKKDLFEDEDNDEQPKQNLSTFEKQKLALQKQIEQYEQENVGKKDWALQGESKARARPENSLLERELDFERGSKPVPIVTQEVTDELEDMIRRRIKTGEFDSLQRRIPTNVVSKAKRSFELEDTKSQKSLAELYEEDYAKTSGEYRTKQSEELDEAHKDIIEHYKQLSNRLDALCAWSYKPKLPQESLTIVANTPTIAMEEAQPTATSSEAMLAPQEIYDPSAKREDKSFVVGSNALPLARDEMTKEQRARERKRAKANNGKKIKAPTSRDSVMSTLKRGNVTVIGKRGEKRDITGRVVKEQRKNDVASLKL